MPNFGIDSRSGTRTPGLPQSSNPISRTSAHKGRKVRIGLLQASEHQCCRQLCTQDSYTSGGQIGDRSGGHYAIGETATLRIPAGPQFLMRTKAHLPTERLSEL